MTSIDFTSKYTGTRKRTFNRLISTALSLFEDGKLPSVSEVASHADVSRATAYRYFPTHSDLVSSIVSESLGPILTWLPDSQKTEERIQELLLFAYLRMFQYEGALRAALQVSLQQWAAARSSTVKVEKRLVRGHRKDILAMIVEPMKDDFSPEIIEKVKRSFSLIYGSEVFLVMKDIWNMDNAEVIKINQWIATAIYNQAIKDNEKSQ
ncbi:TetR/AcrR family transcriptional regulator [Arsenophonus sp. PmNCSU2021_1]|uniref:TetR/AcrR family transcriptional regulator n=1 Tax=Arsenophonus sp. PmNCSU2021_1 TaxID=3118989 RepID=UPI002FF2741C